MQGPSWIAFFRRIPTRWHDSLAVTMTTGAEIVMQSILRLESEFVILRGRMAGSTDAGRVIVLPYTQIVNVAITKRLLENEVHAVFGKGLELGEGHPADAAEMQEVAEPEAVPEGAAMEVEEEAEAPITGATMQLRTAASSPAKAPAAAEKPRVAPPSKSILLARLRARLAEQDK